MTRKEFIDSHSTKLNEYCGMLINDDFIVTKLGVEE